MRLPRLGEQWQEQVVDKCVAAPNSGR